MKVCRAAGLRTQNSELRTQFSHMSIIEHKNFVEWSGGWGRGRRPHKKPSGPGNVLGCRDLARREMKQELVPEEVRVAVCATIDLASGAQLYEGVERPTRDMMEA
ncbi:hypothetical protein YC2023_047318 [Brassica napus]